MPTTTELIDILKTCGHDVPAGLPAEIVRRGEAALEPLSELLRDDALWNADEPSRFMAPLYAFHLLGGIGSTASAPLLIEVVKTQDLGDYLTETAPSVFAALPPSVVAPLMDAARNAELDPYKRNAFAVGLFGIAARNPEHRPEVAAYFLRLLGDADDDLVSMLVDDAARIDDVEVQTAIDIAFDEGRAGGFLVNRKSIDRIRREPPWTLPPRLQDPIAHFFGPLLELAKRNWDDDQRRKAERLDQAARPIPVPKRPDVGRNDPCPCGSGKKYKKCCLP